ncbi:MAG: hypothetical protein ACXW32_03365 [Limisphaerales bacterium]
MDASDKLPRHLAIAFGLAIVIYAAFFTCDQGLRKRKGGWDVTFGTNIAGHASIAVNHAGLGITNVQIFFESEFVTNTNPAGRVIFNKPQQLVPFGKVKFEDLTYLPGSVAFDFFGHEVELLPRTLYLNKKEHPWESGAVFELNPSEKLPPEASFDPRTKKKRRFGR